MSKLRLIFAFTLLPVAILGCSIQTPAQTPTPSSMQDQTQSAGHPALWVVKGPQSTVYLFGSVHLLPKDRQWRTPQLNAAVESSQTLWLEVTGADDPKIAQPILMELGIDAAHPLSSKLSKEQLAKLDTEAKTFNMSEALLEPMRPWFAALTLGVAPLLQSGADSNSGVESILTAEFKKRQRQVAGFETLSQQFHFFADLPPKTELDYLNLTIDDFAKGQAQFKQLVDAWFQGDQERLDSIVDRQWRIEHPEIYEVLIAKRNRYFAQRIEDLIKGEGTSFVAIGAGHYVGPDGVIALLAQDGFQVQKL